MSQSLELSALLKEMFASGNWLGTTCHQCRWSLEPQETLLLQYGLSVFKKKKNNHKMAINVGCQMINRCCSRGAFHARKCRNTNTYDNKNFCAS